MTNEMSWYHCLPTYIKDFKAMASGGEKGGGPNNRDLYVNLWQACAGRLFYIPKVGEEVYYLPQGHIEQVKWYANQDDQMQMPTPVYNLRSKILCKVVNVQLKVDAQIDEVYAHFTLLPLGELEATATAEATPKRAPVCFFSKTLTASDILPRGGFTLPKRHADECFPALDMSQDRPMQNLIMKDLHGQEWPFCQRYRGSPKRHMLTNGWNKFVSTKKLVEGDSIIYLRGKNGDVGIGIRRTMRPPRSPSASVISGHSMLHGILANAAHAVSTATLFTVICHPWTCQACFIIPTTWYTNKSMEEDSSVGTRFSMLFENEECVEQRFTGTVVGIDDIDPVRWPCSKWRCLKVEWDCPAKIHQHPQHISPWNIDRLPSKKTKQVFLQIPPKKPCFRDFGNLGITSSAKLEMHSGVLQGQEKKVTKSATHDRFSSLTLFNVKIAELHSAQAIFNIDDGDSPSPPLDGPT